MFKYKKEKAKKNLELSNRGLQELSKKELTGIGGGNGRVAWAFVGFVLACATAGTGIGAVAVGAFAIGTLVWEVWHS